MVRILTVPLEKFWLKKLPSLDIGDTRIIPWKDLPSNIQEAIEARAKSFVVLDSIVFPFVLEMPVRDDELPRRTLDRALTVFKLFKDDLVLANLIFDGDKLVDYLPHYVHWIDRDRGLKQYQLDKNEASEFADFWKEFIGLPPGNFAVYRFHLADYRAYSRDRLTDYVESLEYLLVPDSGEGEIGYKFRSRGCLLFGENVDASKREAIYNELKELYELRSAIVHGDSSRESRLVPDNIWENRLRPLRHYNREAIKLFFRARCLEDSDKRRALLEKKLLFEAKIA
ncbi:MAG: HEPN domain-containing protein [Candidatus Bathyarchaeota archaeon]|nr:HEPN domain-containing protein [Candidatus Bathyarchaeota archaeon]